MTTEDAATRRNKRYAQLGTAVDNRDVKGVTKVLAGIHFHAAADPKTANYLHLALQHLGFSRRNWEDIATFGDRAIEAAEEAEKAGRSIACISFEKQRKDAAVVRCKQAAHLLGLGTGWLCFCPLPP